MFHYSNTLNRFALNLVTAAVATALVFVPLFSQIAHADSASSTPETSISQDTETDTTPSDTPKSNSSNSDGSAGSDATDDSGSGIIDTGDAVAGADVENVVNSNVNNTGTATDTTSSSGDTSDGNATDTPTVHNAATSTGDEATTSATTTAKTGTSTNPLLSVSNGPASSASTTVADTNAATATNAVNVTADTGGNTATGTGSVIQTGNAVAYANVINVVNTDIFNSQGFFAFLNQVLGTNILDLRNAFSSLDTSGNANSTDSCSQLICGAEVTTNVTNQNDATITNDINVAANTGGNTAGGDGVVGTGNAYAAANVLNVANTNIVDSNYLVISFNNFGNFNNDIVLPSADVFETLFGSGGGTQGSVSNTNSATVDNTISTDASTGGNTAGTDGVVATGNAQSSSAVQNIVNTNQFGGSNFMLVLRVHGNWAGDIFGLPQDVSWQQADNGIVLYSHGDGGGAGTSQPANVRNNNSASVSNNVSVYALTGDNEVGTNGAAQTGNAYAAANVTNIVNTNILSQNWGLLVFDIFGDWNGSLAFGQPDLWVGATAHSKNARIMPGDSVTYTYTVTNRGDAAATNVVLKQLFDKHELGFKKSFDSAIQPELSSSALSQNLGTIEPGQTVKLSYTTTVDKSLPKDQEIPLTINASVTSYEHDANTDDNHDVITVYSGFTRKQGDTNGRIGFPSKLEITKSSDVDQVAPGGTVNYTINVTNHGGALYDAVLKDILQNPSGTVINQQSWNLDTIHNEETVTVSYGIQFSSSSTLGIYTNSAGVSGRDVSNSSVFGHSVLSDVATHDVTVQDPDAPKPAVLGASTECRPYITQYLRFGGNNDSEQVSRLQTFLRDVEGFANVQVTGQFDSATDVALRAFQANYSSDILSPWGANDPTGYVYYTTEKKINEIQCGFERAFPLTSAQLQEIASSRGQHVTSDIAVSTTSSDANKVAERTVTSVINRTGNKYDNMVLPKQSRWPFEKWLSPLLNWLSALTGSELSFR